MYMFSCGFRFSFLTFWFSFWHSLKELNVRKVTLSTDKNKYGIRLRAEPDHMVLGKRLKGAFKAVMMAIKQLNSEDLEQFQKSGECCLTRAPFMPKSQAVPY
jgi:MoaA/NifB/PqqE/SkfB family radical SAM enzyme